MAGLETEFTIAGGVVLAIGLVYVLAGAADTLRVGRRRDEGEFAPDRTTQVERGLRNTGLLALLVVALYFLDVLPV